MMRLRPPTIKPGEDKNRSKGGVKFAQRANVFSCMKDGRVGLLPVERLPNTTRTARALYPLWSA